VIVVEILAVVTLVVVIHQAVVLRYLQFQNIPVTYIRNYYEREVNLMNQGPEVVHIERKDQEGVVVDRVQKVMIVNLGVDHEIQVEEIVDQALVQRVVHIAVVLQRVKIPALLVSIS